MVVSCKQDVYDWFQNLDAPSRVDFFCTLLKCHCSPWEIRFYGTCLEQRAQESHGELRRHKVHENYHRTLHEHMLNSTVNILDRPEDIGALIMYIAIYLKSKPSDAVCSKIPFDIITEIGKQLQLRMQNPSERTVCDKHLQEDIFLLFTLALHHPAFAFSQHQAMRRQLEHVTKMFGRFSSDKRLPKKRDSQCQTDNTQQANSLPPLPSSVPSTRTTYRIDQLNLLCSKKIKADIVYTIEVKYNSCQVVTVQKSHQDIRLIHDKILSQFPADVKASKDVRNIPLLNAGDSSESVIASYLRDLCHMAPEFLDSKPMLQFFLPQHSLNDLSPVAKTTTSESCKRADILACDTSVPPPSITPGTNKSIPKPMVPVYALLDSEYDSFPRPMQTVIVNNSSIYPSTATITAGTQSMMAADNCTSRVACHTPPTSTLQSSPMLQMSKEDLKAKGMGDAAVKKLSEHLEIINSDLENSGPMTAPDDPLPAAKGTFPSQPISGDFSSSNLCSPHASSYSRSGGQLTHSQDTQHKQLVLTSNTTTHPNLEPRPKPGKGVQRSRSSSNLYAFPVSSSTTNMMTVSADSWCSKSDKGSITSLRSPKTESVSVTKISNHQPSTNQPNSRLNDSTPSKAGKPPAKPVGNRGQHSPRVSESRTAPKSQLTKQSETGQANGPAVGGKPLTVEEIQQRQREQSLQRQHSHEPCSGQTPLSPGSINSTHTLPVRPPHLSQPQLPGSVAQVSTTAHPTLPPPPVMPPACPQQPPQHSKSKQQTYALRKHQKSPAQQTVHVQHRQPTPPPVTNQQAADQSLLPCSSPSSLSTQSTSPVPASDSCAALRNLTTANSLDEQVDGESDGFSVASCSPSTKGSSADKSAPMMSNGSRAQPQGDTLTDALDDPDITVTTGHTLAVMQQRYLPGSMEDSSYFFPNGYKHYPFPAQDAERIIAPDGSQVYSSPFSCPKCVISAQCYMSVPPPPVRPSSHPPPSNMPPQHQNNIVYQSYPGGFIPTSNGLVSPGMTSFNRPNPPGGLPPNGMVQRNDMVYQPVAYLPPNTTRPAVYHAGPAGLPPQFHQQMPSGYQFYAHPPPFNKRQVHCTNCGLPNHSRNDCQDPLDTSAQINQYQLDMQPRSEVPE